MFILQVLAMNDKVPFSRLEGTTSNVLPLIISLEWSSKYHWYPYIPSKYTGTYMIPTVQYVTAIQDIGMNDQ